MFHTHLQSSCCMRILYFDQSSASDTITVQHDGTQPHIHCCLFYFTRGFVSNFASGLNGELTRSTDTVYTNALLTTLNARDHLRKINGADSLPRPLYSLASNTMSNPALMEYPAFPAVFRGNGTVRICLI